MNRETDLEERPLGDSGVELTTLGYGAWEAGGGTTWGNVDVREAEDALAAAFDAGVNWVDTAHVYGGGGGSEEIVGRVVAARPDVLVSTKIAPEPEDAYSRAGMRRELHRALRRLGREHIDVYLLHWPAEHVPLAETWAAMDELKQEGLVRAIGLSNYPVGDVDACRAIAPVDVVQIPMSLLDLVTYDEHVRSAQQHGTGILTYGTLAYGLLADPSRHSYDDWRGGEVARDDFFVDENYLRFFAPDTRPAIDDTLAGLASVAGDACVALPDAALRWVIEQPGVTAALVGSTRSSHVLSNVAAAVRDLPRETTRALTATVRA